MNEVQGRERWMERCRIAGGIIDQKNAKEEKKGGLGTGKETKMNQRVLSM